jgi:hypothetical protein
MSENEEKVDAQDEEIAPVEEGATTDWETRAKELEQKAIRQRDTTRDLRKELKELKAKVPEQSTQQPTAKKKEFDYAEMAYLNSKGVEESDYDYIFKEVQSTGKSLKDTLAFKYVQEELKTLKQGREVQSALPTSKRAGGTAHDEVGYWVAKGEYPADTPDNRKLRADIMKYKVKTERGNAPSASLNM